jgi:hypothetical protein
LHMLLQIPDGLQSVSVITCKASLIQGSHWDAEVRSISVMKGRYYICNEGQHICPA